MWIWKPLDKFDNERSAIRTKILSVICVMKTVPLVILNRISTANFGSINKSRYTEHSIVASIPESCMGRFAMWFSHFSVHFSRDNGMAGGTRHLFSEQISSPFAWALLQVPGMMSTNTWIVPCTLTSYDELVFTFPASLFHFDSDSLFWSICRSSTMQAQTGWCLCALQHYTPYTFYNFTWCNAALL